MTMINIIVLSTVLGHVTCISRGFIPNSGGCGREIIQYGCECHTISGLVIMCKDLDLEHWPRFGDMGDVYVDMLDVSGNAFDHIPSNAFGDLRISNLVMSNNRNMFRNSNVSNVFNEHQASTLLSLDLRDNGFGSIPSFIGSLTSLRTLNLVGNNINTIPNSMMDSSPDLRDLRLGHVRYFAGHAFDSIPSLRVLEASPQNRVSVSILDSFGRSNTRYIRYLQTLVIRDASRIFMDRELLSLLQLVHLEIVNSSVDAAQLDAAQAPPAYPSMRTINFSRNNIAYIPDTFLTYFYELTSVDFSHNVIEEVKSNSFFENPKLRYVDLSHNNIVYVFRETFFEHVHLEVLDLSHNRLRIITEDIFPENTAGLVVYLAANDFMCGCYIQWLVNLSAQQHTGVRSVLDPYEVDNELTCASGQDRPLLYTLRQMMAGYCGNFS